MKYIKLFEDFIKDEEDPLAALGGGGNEKPKEDPLDKEKKKKDAENAKAAKKHDELVDKKEDTIESLLDKNPEVREKLGEIILKAIDKQDRVLIHNAVNDLIYMQMDYQESGNISKVAGITKIKEVLDTLDRSFTSSKRM